jgi:hypothetical protein
MFESDYKSVQGYLPEYSFMQSPLSDTLAKVNLYNKTYLIKR